MDQRGAGKSKPTTELQENTTHDLVSDIEAIRLHLKIPKWHLLFGGSWGSTLALLYAQAYPDAVGAMILRGIFTTRDAEVAWLYGGYGAANIFPEAWEAFISFLPPEQRRAPVAAYYKLLTGDDRALRIAAAREWSRWDLSVDSLVPNESGFAMLEDDEWVLAHALMAAHFAVHHFWLDEGQILKVENLAKIQHIPGEFDSSALRRHKTFPKLTGPGTIIQGRYDMVAPPQTAWDLHKLWVKSKLIWIPDAGHGAKVWI